MMDYSKVIDAQTWAFIKKTQEFYPDDTITQTIQEQRNVYNRMCEAFFAPHPSAVTCHDTTFADIPVRIYETNNTERTALYLHGGGFVVGGLHSHDDVCAEICSLANIRVISADYRLSPEHMHPAAFNDALNATQIAAKQFNSPVLLVGDSAGASLVAAVSHHLRNTDITVSGQVLIYPTLGGDMTRGSYIAHAHAPLLTLEDIQFYHHVRTKGAPPTNDPTYAPLQDNDFSNLPPTVAITAECDPLCDDGREYCEKINAAGGQAHWINETGLIHGYLRARHTAERARNSFDQIVSAITNLSQNKWPY